MGDGAGPPPVLTTADRALVEDLEAAAAARWGEEFAISIRRWSDGTAQVYAEHLRGLTEDGDRVKERLLPDGEGKFGHDVVIEKRAETVSHGVIEYPVDAGDADEG